MRSLKKPFTTYYEDMKADLNRYEEEYTLYPKKAAFRMLVWNLLFLFARQGRVKQKDSVWIDSTCWYGRGKKTAFPYESIQKDSDIIIYGANDTGRLLAQQIKVTKYCNILCFVDKGAIVKNRRRFEGYLLQISRNLTSIPDFDYIVVAQDSDERKSEIFKELYKYKIPLEKVIFDVRTYQIKKKISFSKYPRIYAIVTGGLGDYIVQKRFLTELRNLDPKVELYITSNDLRKKEFLSAVYFDLPRTVITYENESDIIFSEYDMVFRLDHIMTLLYVNKTQMKMKSDKLLAFAKTWLKNYDHIKEYNTKMPWESVVHVERARILGLNRYQIMGTYTNMEISDTKVRIGLKRPFRKSYEDLGLKGAYITLNRGAEARPDGKTQVKVWPLEYYHVLIRLIKSAYPKLKIVQIGNGEKERFKGADYYVLDQHIETVKYVLKDSLLHIDCEGGLVHLATQLGTKCIVLFGPTPAFYYGYKENINIVSEKCRDCMGTTEEWFTECYRKEAYPPRCMKAITPKIVYDALCRELERRGKQDEKDKKDGEDAASGEAACTYGSKRR